MSRTHLKITRPARDLERDLVNACRRTAEQMGAYLELINQLDGRGAGTTKGAPDAFLYASGHCCPIEFKTVGGRLSEDQLTCLGRREMQHVRTYVVRTVEQFVDIVNGLRKGLT